MNKLRALNDFLKARDLVPAESFDSWAETASMELVWKPDEKGMWMGDMPYTGFFSLEGYQGEPTYLMALLGSWLETYDDDRDDLPGPTFQVDVTDLALDIADVTISLQFVEPQYLTEDPDGTIEVFGKRWSTIPYELWVAEHGEVVRHDSV